MKPASRELLTLTAGVALVLVLAGCSTVPPPENYDAAWPEEVPVAAHGNGAIFQAGHDVPLFENAIARRVGDTVTINLVESTAAQKSASTNTSKSSNISMPAPLLFGNPATINGNQVFENSLQNNREFEGTGDSQLSNRLQGYITVTVAQRLPNGNLLVRGQKWIGINQGKEYVRLQGVIRPIDIQPDNSIASYKVADAMISYGGKGAINDANRPGLLSRFFNSIWNPL